MFKEGGKEVKENQERLTSALELLKKFQDEMPAIPPFKPTFARFVPLIMLQNSVVAIVTKSNLTAPPKS